MAATEPAVAGGVSFALTEEQKELRALAREFAAKEIRPVAAEHDVHMRHPVEVIAKAHAVGLMNLHVPTEYGGLGRISLVANSRASARSSFCSSVSANETPRDCSTVAMVVSPGNVVSKAPCAQPRFTASCSDSPESRP